MSVVEDDFLTGAKVGTIAASTGAPTQRPINGRTAYPMSIGGPIRTGTRIDTGDADNVTIMFVDGSTLSLGFNTRLTIPAGGSAEDAARPRFVILEAGRISATVVHRADNAMFSVRTPAATAEVLGTTFGIGMSRAKDSNRPQAVLEVREGQVAFFNEHGRVVATSATQCSATQDNPPTSPKRISVLRTFFVGRGIQMSMTTHRLTLTEAMSRLSVPTGSIGAEIDEDPIDATKNDDWIVKRVAPLSPAQRAGLLAGDAVLGWNGQKFSPDLMVRTILSADASLVQLSIARNGRHRTTSIQFDPSLLRPSSTYRLNPTKQHGSLVQAVFSSRVSHGLAQIARKVRRAGDAAQINDVGIALEVRDMVDEAIAAFQDSVRIEPNNALYRFNLGMALRKIGNLERSLEELESSADLEPTWPQPRREIAAGLMVIGDVIRASEVVERVNVEFPRNASSLACSGDIALGNSLVDEAQIKYVSALQLDPDNLAAAIGLSRIERQKRHHEDSILRLERRTRFRPYDFDLYMALGDAYLDYGLDEEARKAYGRATLLEPRDPRPVSAMAFTYVGRSLIPSSMRTAARAELAEQYAQKAIELGDKSSATRIALEISKYWRYPPKEDEVLLAEALKGEPRNSLAYRAAAECVYLYRRPEQAAELFELAADLDPLDVQSRLSAGRNFRRAGNLFRAEEQLLMAVEVEPSNHRVWVELGEVALELGDVIRSESYFKRAINLDSMDASPYFKLAKMRSTSHLHQEAIELYLRGIRQSGVFGVSVVQHQGISGIEELKELVAEITQAIQRNRPELGAAKLREYERLRNKISALLAMPGAEPSEAIHQVPVPFTVEIGQVLAALRAFRVELLEESLVAEPNDPAIACMLGLELLAQGNMGRARHLLKFSVEKGREDFRALSALGRIDGNDNNLADTDQWLSRALATPEGMTNLSIRGTLALNLFSRGANLERALLYVRKFRTQMIGFAQFERLTAEILLGLGRHDEADVEIAQAIETYRKKLLPPDESAKPLVERERSKKMFAEYFCVQGRIKERLGERANALKAYLEAKSLDPDSLEAAASVTRLGSG